MGPYGLRDRRYGAVLVTVAGKIERHPFPSLGGSGSFGKIDCRRSAFGPICLQCFLSDRGGMTEKDYLID